MSGDGGLANWICTAWMIGGTLILASLAVFTFRRISSSDTQRRDSASENSSLITITRTVTLAVEGPSDGLSPVPALTRTVQGFDLIREADPGFDEQDFYDRVGWLYVKLHHALTDQSLDAIRDFTDDGALRTLQNRIDRLARDGHAEVFKHLRIESIRAVSVRQSETTQWVVLHIAASAAVAVIERGTGRLVAPDTNGDGVARRRLVESWTLSRPAGLRSAPRPPIHKCPFCGGPVEENRRYVCTYCGTDLRGPEREWTILAWERE